jgi:5-methylcytosine-specific restriction endonuclease McrA
LNKLPDCLRELHFDSYLIDETPQKKASEQPPPPPPPPPPTRKKPLKKKKPYRRADGVLYNARRCRRLLKNGGSHTDEEWQELLKKHNYRCVNCGIHADDAKAYLGNYGLTKDHIIPVSKGGVDDISNIQPLCWDCNRKKGPQYSTKIKSDRRIK